jgi:hypothetical protein
MSSSDGDALRAEVRSLLESTRLAGIAFVALSMTRKEGDAPTSEVQFPVEVELGVQVTDEGAAYRITLSVERPDIEVSVSVVAGYHAQDPSAFAEPHVAQAFGELVALPAAYPFARAKMQELTIDTGAPPVLLGILDMTKTVFNRLPEAAATNAVVEGGDTPESKSTGQESD